VKCHHEVQMCKTCNFGLHEFPTELWPFDYFYIYYVKEVKQHTMYFYLWDSMVL